MFTAFESFAHTGSNIYIKSMIPGKKILTNFTSKIVSTKLKVANLQWKLLFKYVATIVRLVDLDNCSSSELLEVTVLPRCQLESYRTFTQTLNLRSYSTPLGTPQVHTRLAFLSLYEWSEQQRYLKGYKTKNYSKLLYCQDVS